MFRPAFLFFLLVLNLSVHAESDSQPRTSPLAPNDIIALVGGEDFVAASEYGFLEYLLIRAKPDYHLRFRSLAWEGDTVYEQPRDLNYPTLRQQLDKIRATVVLTQFGQMEAADLSNLIPEKSGEKNETTFGRAYARLLSGLGCGDANLHRKFAIVFPTPLGTSALALSPEVAPGLCASALFYLARRLSIPAIPLGMEFGSLALPSFTRDGVHLDEYGHAVAARLITNDLLHETLRIPSTTEFAQYPIAQTDDEKRLLRLIVEKNRLWFRYTRPQNWAFLAGDRTEQPSSRDHKDPAIRWFPAEMEQWLPLIEKKETEIDQLALQLGNEEHAAPK
jgi:hypothetical protein